MGDGKRKNSCEYSSDNANGQLGKYGEGPNVETKEETLPGLIYPCLTVEVCCLEESHGYCRPCVSGVMYGKPSTEIYC